MAGRWADTARPGWRPSQARRRARVQWPRPGGRRVGERKHREPDLLLVRDARDPRRRDRYWLGADLVAEVVSLDIPERDLVQKREEYAAAGILEYWTVDPRVETIGVLRLEGGAYVEHGVFARGEQATSALLAEFAVGVDELFDAD